MKKFICLLVLLPCLFSQLFAKDVDSATARIVAQNFLLANGSSVASLSLAYECKIESFNPIAQQTGEHLYYVFTGSNGKGFIIVSGDDVVTPVLGYSNTDVYDLNNLPPAFRKWMDGYKNQIIAAKENNLEATAKIQQAWTNLINGQFHPLTRGAVLPLLSTIWDQGQYYDADCPYDSSYKQQTVTGCVATAMAQIMKYWAYPAQGEGFHSYNSPTYGTLAANFGNTTYNWSNMPVNVVSANANVATLMYDCGVSVEMNYGVASTGGSGAYVITADNPVCAQTAYVNYFKYDNSSIKGLYRKNYTDNNWIALLETELDSSRPVQYVGSGSGGGHTWVCDGYDANNYFHMNWGWSDLADGYYTIDSLNPTATGIGGGLGAFNNNEEALIGIKPGNGSGGGGGSTGPVLDIEMDTTIVVTPSVLGFLQPFSVSYNVVNAGTTDFQGTFAAAIFTPAGVFVDYIDTLSTDSIGGHFQPGARFASPGISINGEGLFEAPGNYTLAIMYKPKGGNWNNVGHTSYANPINLTITGPVNAINLNSTVNLTPATFTTGQPASVNINVINNSNRVYKGQYFVALYDFSGNIVQQFGQYVESNGLGIGKTYSSPYVTLNTTAITAPPGTYLLAAYEGEQDSTYADMLGGAHFNNPILVTVVGQPIQPDRYEPDNTQSTAYSLPIAWANDAAHVQTTGSNINVGNDYDYYKLILPAGYDYTITARVQDSYSSDNDSVYTDDVGWSYTTDTAWSAVYDPIMPGNIQVTGPDTVTFFVAPYFPGLLGTYLLDIHLTRTGGTAVKNMAANSGLLLYPNPAAGVVNVTITGTTPTQVKVMDMVGRTVYAQTWYNSHRQIDVSGFSDGIYYLEAIDNKQNQQVVKFVVNH